MAKPKEERAQTPPLSAEDVRIFRRTAVLAEMLGSDILKNHADQLSFVLNNLMESVASAPSRLTTLRGVTAMGRPITLPLLSSQELLPTWMWNRLGEEVLSKDIRSLGQQDIEDIYKRLIDMYPNSLDLSQQHGREAVATIIALRAILEEKIFTPELLLSVALEEERAGASDGADGELPVQRQFSAAEREAFASAAVLLARRPQLRPAFDAMVDGLEDLMRRLG